MAKKSSIFQSPPKLPGILSTKLLRVQNAYFTAGAVWEACGNRWLCREAAPIIKWMIGKDPSAVKLELARLGCSYEWRDVQ